MIDVNTDGKMTAISSAAALPKSAPTKITVPGRGSPADDEMDLAVLDQRIADAQEDEIAAKTDTDRQKAAQFGG